MALAFNRALNAAIANAEPAAAATVVSAEIDIGDDTIAEQVWLHVTVSDWAAAPTGNLQAGIQPMHTSSGTVFDDNTAFAVATVSADAQYDFAFPLTSLPRFLKVAVKNNSSQNVADNCCHAWLEYVAVTA